MSSVYSLSTTGAITGSGSATQLAVWDSASSVTGYSTLTYVSSVLYASTYGTNTANGASAGTIRLAKTDSIYWRNDANTADNKLYQSSDVLIYEQTVAGAATTLQILNSDNTNTASHSKLQIAAGGASGGDPYIYWSINSGGIYSLGIDNSDLDALVLTNASTLSTTNLLRIAKDWTTGNDAYRWYYTNTLANTVSATPFGAVYFDTVLSSGTNPSVILGVSHGMSGPYTGDGQVFGFASTVTSTGTGINPSLLKMNGAYSGNVSGTTVGMNVGYRARVQNGDVSVGGFFTTETMKNSAKYFGVIGACKNTNSGANGVAGYFVSAVETDFAGASDFTSTAATVVIDNKAIAIPPLVVQDNGTDKFVILDGGSIGVANYAAATVAVGALANKIEIFDAAGTSLGFIPVYATIT